MTETQLKNISLPPNSETVLCMGNFDGVHLGHCALIDAAVSRAREQKRLSMVVTFYPHTKEVTTTTASPVLLSTHQEKVQLIAARGVDYLVTIPFSTELAQKSAEEFIVDVLINQCAMKELIIGPNQVFGKNRSGDHNFLRNLMSTNHFTLFPIDWKTLQLQTVSSTGIRSAIARADMDRAMEMLGHPYLIIAEHISGKKKGTELGFPTLNFKIPPSQKLVPPPGIYAAELHYHDTTWKGALYFGNCPTFEKRDFHFEFHAFDFRNNRPLPGDFASLWIYRFVRNDQTFAQESDLTSAINNDIKCIELFFQEKSHASY